MKKRQFLSATFAAALAPALAVRAEEDGFTALFDGKTLKGWKNPYTFGKAEIVNGEIHLTAEKKFFLVSDKSYTDFVFEAEVHLPEGKANSGFMFRAHVEGAGTDQAKVFGYQAEVDGDEKRKWAGGLFDEGRRKWFISPRNDAKKNNVEEKKACEVSIAAFHLRAGDCFKRNDWNNYRITCQGKKIKIEVNGVVTTDVQDDMDAMGPLGIQHHGEKGAVYRFRNLRIIELK